MYTSFFFFFSIILKNITMKLSKYTTPTPPSSRMRKKLLVYAHAELLLNNCSTYDSLWAQIIDKQWITKVLGQQLKWKAIYSECYVLTFCHFQCNALIADFYVISFHPIHLHFLCVPLHLCFTVVYVLRIGQPIRQQRTTVNMCSLLTEHNLLTELKPNVYNVALTWPKRHNYNLSI